MKYNGRNIILDRDVTVTSPQHIGESLSNIIETHESDINTLKSNVGWIYKHGGVGSGMGGSGTVTSPWNFKVEINDVAQEHNDTINLGKQGEYKLTVLLYKVQGRTFTIKCTYTTTSGVRILERTISPNQNPILTEIIDLQVNGTLTIAINDDEGNFDLFILDYIVTAYSFDLRYVLNDPQHTIYLPQDNNIFINNVKDLGLLAELSYIISVDTLKAYVTYTNWNGDIIEEPLSKGKNNLRLSLGKLLIDDNAGNYTFLAEIHLLLQGKDEEEEIPILKLQDNLIPSNIYLKIESDGVIYSDTTQTNPYLYYLGTIPFKIVPYQGFADLSSMYSLLVKLNDVDYTTMVLTDQKPATLNITTELLEWNKVTFIMTRKGETFTKSYYFFTKNPLGNFNWYITHELNGTSYTTLPVLSYLYKEGRDIYKHENVKNIPGTSKKLISKLSLDTKSTVFSCSVDKKYLAYDFMFAVGIKYSKLNDVNKAILLIASGNNYIIIYLNKISLFNSDYKIYLPKNEYHLLTIYRRSVSSSNALPLFEWDIYIDGVLEISTSTFSTIQETYNTILLDPGLYDINYLELSYFNHNIINEDNQFYKYNLNPQKEFLQYLNDEGVLYHYYSYKLTFEPESIPENFLDVFVYASQFYNDYYKNRVKVNQTIINNISERLEIPVLMLEYTEERTLTTNWSSDGESFMEWLENHYDIITNTTATDILYPVKVQWSRGKETLKTVETDPNMLFRISLLGTSTLLYTNKNLDLFTYSPDEENVYLYSPNYNLEDSTTFLPERRFTLKADVVDSSHSNNNSLGKFINTISTKFAGAKLTNSKYSSYIKNTIEGFPILLFIKNSYFTNSTVINPTEDYYYLGIYNFNLGRDSEYNLGYKDLRLLPDSIPSGFAVTKVPVNKTLNSGTTLNAEGYLNGFGVAEIRENRNYFDFSQSDPSFLFPLSELDNDYVFGKLKSNSEDLLKTSLRNLVEKVSKASGFIFDSLGKNMLPEGSYDLGYKSPIPQNLVPNYHKKLIRKFINAASVLEDTGIILLGTSSDLINTIVGVVNELNPALDYKSLSEYYVICMAFGLVDSVMKNLNLKTWNSETFYAAFYDIDTALQKDNAGNDTNYIAFSDYWEAAQHVEGGSTFLDPAISYKDWFNRDVNGYDIPMTYLLALAKYSYLFIEGNQSIEDWYPNNVWARFRRSSTNIPGWNKPADLNSAHIGCLTTADSFIDGYFKNHLSKIPDVFFNLNYRKKYFVLNKEGETGFVTEDFKKFSGRRIYSVRDWLNSRFHLLDLYFNLGTIPDNINTYDLETQQWISQENKAYKIPSPNFIDSENKDILILRDIFSAENSNTKYSKNIDVKFNSEEYSPLCLSGQTTARYLTKDGNTEYTLSLETAGKSLKLGGSGNWTYINNINSLLPEQGEFYVNSDKLTTLFGNLGSCNGWSLTLPALLDVSLTSPLYSGVLNFESLSNLNTINISGSKLGLNIDNLNVTSINASNVSYASELQITNCNKLTNLNINGSIFQRINIVPIKKNVVFFSDSLYEKNSSDEWVKTSTNSSAKCNTLLLTNDSNEGVIFIENLLFLRNKIYEGLQEITLKGFKEIYIDSCNFLQSVVIEDPENVQKFTVTNSSSQAPYLKINSQENNVIDLSLFTQLSELYFYNTKKFTKVIAPKDVSLKSSCFYNTSILYLEGTDLTLSLRAFNQSSFTLLQSPNGPLCSFKSFDSNLSGTFNGCNVGKDTFDLFNSTYRSLLSGVTVVDSMWAYVGSLKYTEEELEEDYLAGRCRFDLSMYNNVTSAQSMFGGTNKTTCHPDIFNGFGSSAGVDISNFFGWSNQKEVSIPINWLARIRNRATKFNSSEKNIVYKVLREGSVSLLTEFYPYQLLGSDIVTSLENWNFDSNHVINLQGGFNGFANLTSISYSFCGCSAKNILYSQNEVVRGFLYSKPKIKNIIGSFGFNNYDSLSVDLEEFLPWETLESNNKQFLYALDWDEKYHVMEFNKTVLNVFNLQTIFECLVKKYTASTLAHVFRNCVLMNPEGEFNFGSGYKNTTITSIPYLFSKLQSDEGINFDWNIFKILPNIKDARHSFEYVHFANMLPFNLFLKREVENNNITKYVKDGSEFVPVKLKTYKYKQDINNLQYCFANCEFDIPMFKMEDIVYDSDNINSPGVAWRDVDGLRIYYNSYYNSQSVLASEVLINNPEFDDLNFDASYSSIVPDVVVNTINPNSEDTYLNFSLYDVSDYNNPFVSPDFFYGCSASANVSYCFSNSKLLGYIPDNLFKNCKTAVITHFIENVLILPKQWKQVQDEVGNFYDLSYYIGSNFINSTSLDNAFSFQMCLPGKVIQTQNEGKSVLLRDLYIFCFKDSFNKMLESARHMYPKNINEVPTNCIFTVQHYNNNVLLAVMYDKNSEVDGYLGNIGFDLSRTYTNLNADNLMNNIFMQFGYGRLFDTYTTLSSIKKRYISTTSWVMQLGNSDGTFGVSRNLILPSAPSNNPSSLFLSSIRYVKSGDTWTKDNDGTSISIHLSQVDGYTETSKTNYNNSRSNNSYELKFI